MGKKSSYKDPLYRLIRGQVKSARNDHPEWGLPKVAEHSIAKRIYGDLKGQIEGDKFPKGES